MAPPWPKLVAETSPMDTADLVNDAMVEYCFLWKGLSCLLGHLPPVPEELFGIAWDLSKNWPQHLAPQWPKLVPKTSTMDTDLVNDAMVEYCGFLEGAVLPPWLPTTSTRGIIWNFLGLLQKVAATSGSTMAPVGVRDTPQGHRPRQ